MKFKNSFLFFLWVFALLCFKVGYTQKPVDSLGYHINNINLAQSESNLSNAYKFLKKDLLLNEKKGRKGAQIYNLYFLSKIDFIIGFYDESEALAVKALSFLDKLEVNDYNTSLRISLFNHLGKVYREKQIYSEAIKKYNQVLVLTKKAKDSLIVYNNISNSLKDENKFKEAEALLLEASNLFPRVKDTLEIARVIDNLGYINFKLHKESALPYLNKALELRKQSQNSSDLYSSYRNLSEYYVSNADSVKAKLYALKAYKVAGLVNSLSYKLDASRLRMDIGDYAVAKEYLSLNDSLQNAKKQTQNRFALLKYDLAESETKSQEERSKSQLYKFIAVLIFISGGFLIFILKARHKKENLQQVFKTEARISKKVHDEVANDVYHIMTKLQSETTINETLLDDLESIYTKTRDISRENNAVMVTENFDELLTDLLLNYKSETTNVITRNLSTISWHSFSELKKITIYRVLQELMVNMKKHSQASFVVVRFSKTNDSLVITYKDNGIGTTLNIANGLQNVENRIAAIKGTITFETEVNNGFKTIIKV